MKYLREYILDSLADGKCYFTKEEAMAELKTTPSQFRFQAYRLIQKHTIKHITRGFYMIIAPEYQHMKIVPLHWIIDPLMKYLKQDYYIGLLSAASIYGTTHQQPMQFQVVTDKARRDILLGTSSIVFFSIQNFSHRLKEQITSSSSGYANISTKPQTMLDMLRFYKASGYLSNVASVTSALSEDMNNKDFIQCLKSEQNNSILQRLGYILALLGKNHLAQLVKKEVDTRTVQYIPLNPDIAIQDGKKIREFKIIENDTLEIEE